MDKVKKKGGNVCTRRTCRYTEQQRINAANRTEEFSEIVCNICKKKKWACTRCAKKSSGSFAFVNRKLHMENRYAHSTLKRPSGIRTAKAATPSGQTRTLHPSVPRMKPPRIYRSTKQEFVSASLLHGIERYVPINELATANDESQSCETDNQRTKLSMDDVKARLPKIVWERLTKLFDKGILKYSQESDKPFSLCINTTKTSYSPLRTDSLATLLIVVGGMGHRRVFVAKNPGNANRIQDGIGVIWKQDVDSGDDIVWLAEETKESWQDLMQKNTNANTVVSFTLLAGGALLIPSGLLHGVLCYGTSTMLSIPVL